MSSPARNVLDYWVLRQEGTLIVRYNSEFNRVSWKRLKSIAEKTLKECDVWDSTVLNDGWGVQPHGTQHVEIGSLDNIPYIAFPIKDPTGKVNVCIETQVGFESCLGVKLSDLAEYKYVSDGQHKHGKGKK